MTLLIKKRVYLNNIKNQPGSGPSFVFLEGKQGMNGGEELELLGPD